MDNVGSTPTLLCLLDNEVKVGKRQDNFKNQQNAKALCNMKDLVDSCQWHVESLECCIYSKQDATFAFKELRSCLANIEDQIDTLEKLLPTEAVPIASKNSRAARGKLNLHETDRELRDHVKVERYNQNT